MTYWDGENTDRIKNKWMGDWETESSTEILNNWENLKYTYWEREEQYMCVMDSKLVVTLSYIPVVFCTPQKCQSSRPESSISPRDAEPAML